MAKNFERCVLPSHLNRLRGSLATLQCKLVAFDAVPHRAAQVVGGGNLSPQQQWRLRIPPLREKDFSDFS